MEEGGKMKRSASYFCTWNAQNFGRKDAALEKNGSIFLGSEGAKKARDAMNEEFIFGQGGLADQYGPIRDCLYFVLDDGWDVPYGVHPDSQIEAFGSLEMSGDRFPSFPGSPAERLKGVNQALMERGWKGLGLWVAAQAKGESYEAGFFEPDRSRRYWRERLAWSREAGVGYGKVDWGCRQFDPAWRRMLDELRDKEAPSLLIEHCHPAAAPVNNAYFEGGRQVTDGRFASWGQWPEKWAEIMEGAGIFRTYDVLTQFTQVSTVDRLAALMAARPDADTILNCEDEAYLGAVMGCSLGVMRSEKCRDIPVFCYDPQGNSHRTAETVRAVNWQRIAPPYPIREGRLSAGRELIEEAFLFNAGETWMEDYVGHEVIQRCPSTVMRGDISCEIVDLEGRRALAAVSRHPSGPVAAAILPRGDKKGGVSIPKAGIVLDLTDSGQPIGIFGSWEWVLLKHTCGKRIFACDLADDPGAALTDVTGETIWQEDEITIPARLLDRICQNPPGGAGQSEPGALFCLR